MDRAIQAGHKFDQSQFGDRLDKQLRAPGYFTTGWSPVPIVDCLLADMGATKIWRNPDGMVDNVVGVQKPEHYRGIIEADFSSTSS